MKDISDSLKKIKKIIADTESDATIIKKIIEDTIHADFLGNLSIKDGILIIQASASERSAIFLKKNELIENLRSKGFFISELR